MQIPALNSHGDSSKQGYGEIFIDRTIKVSKDLSAGAVAAIVAKTIIAPVERVKLILQVSLIIYNIIIIIIINIYSFKQHKLQ